MRFSPAIVVWFWSAILVSVLAMKLSSLKLKFKASRTAPPTAKFLLLSPVLSTTTWEKRRPFDRTDLRRFAFEAGAFFALFVASRRLYATFVPALRPGLIAQSYLSLIPLYLMGQFLSVAFELAYLPTGWRFPAHFRYPPLSRSIAEFWGSRWATWVADWLRQMVFGRFRRFPFLGIVAAFVISGLWHELLLNVPLYLFFGVNLLGSWTLYFLIQAAGILAERKLPLGHGLARRVFTWAVILIPAPLAINEAVLRCWGVFIPSG